MSIEFMKVEPGQPGYLQDFPQQCICGAQKGPIVATHLTYATVGGNSGHIYVCRMCATRIARALGLIKGAEFERLQNAADELVVLQQEVAVRQEIIDRNAGTLGENEAKIQAQRAYIETLQGELALKKSHANQILAQAREMAAA